MRQINHWGKLLLAVLLVHQTVLSAEFMYQVSTGQTFYLAQQHPTLGTMRSTLVEVDFAPDGTISNRRILDEHFNREQITFVAPSGNGKMVLFTRHKDSGRKRIYLKDGMTKASAVRSLSNHIATMFGDADFKDVAVVGSHVYILTTKALWKHGLNPANYQAERVVFAGDWTKVTKLLAVGKNLVFTDSDGRLFTIDTEAGTAPTKFGQGWGADIDLVAINEKELVISSPRFTNLQIKVAGSFASSRSAGPYVSGMSVGDVSLYDHNGKIFAVRLPDQFLLKKQAQKFPGILQELKTKHKKTSHWAWYVFPSEVVGRSEPLPKTKVDDERVDFVLANADLNAWSEILENIATLLETNPLKINPRNANSAIIPSIDHLRVGGFLDFWLITHGHKTSNHQRFFDALTRLNRFKW